MELAEEGRIQVIVTWKLDRMFRSLKEASLAQETLAKCKVDLVSYTEPFDTTTSIGRFVFGFLVNVAAFETDLIKERALLGFERRVREGKWTGAHKPFGYRCGADGRLQIDPVEAKVVRSVFRNYQRLGGDRQLAAWLNERSIRWRGQPWTTERVRRTLTNPVAAGRLSLRGVTAVHSELALISQATFDATAQQRDGLRHLGKHRSSPETAAGLDRVLSAYLASLDDPSTESLD